MTSEFAIQEQAKRDLRNQLADMGNTEQQEILFQEWSPGRKIVRLWSMIDGLPIDIPQYMVAAALSKRHRGKYSFTAKENEAPPIKNGDVRCFLAEDSPERVSGLLDEAGLGHIEPCPATELRSDYSKRMHGNNRHPQSWAILNEFIAKKENEEFRSEQRKQTAAILSLAGQRAEPVETKSDNNITVLEPLIIGRASEILVCEDCGWATKVDSKKPAASLNTHKRLHCPARKQES